MDAGDRLDAARSARGARTGLCGAGAGLFDPRGWSARGGGCAWYKVKIDFAAIPHDGVYFMERLGAMSVGRILAGEMPTIVSEQFSLAGLSPYPTLGVDRFWCSCPDWSKPCKHIAAVLYLLGDALIRDPSLLLRLRGVCFGKRDAAGVALPLWKGSIRLADALARIYRRTGLADGR